MKRFLWTTAVACVVVFGFLPQAKAATINDYIVYYAQSNLGRQVGNGECWTLADYALRYAGAQEPGTGGMGLYQFGQVVSPGSLLYPGDVIQFEGCSFVHRYPNGGWSSMSMPHHTAIVAAIRGTQVTVLNENVGGDKRVKYTTIDFADMQQGRVTYYRPVARYR